MDEPGRIISAPSMRHPDHTGKNGEAKNEQIKTLCLLSGKNNKGDYQPYNRDESKEQLIHRILLAPLPVTKFAACHIDRKGNWYRGSRCDEGHETWETFA